MRFLRWLIRMTAYALGLLVFVTLVLMVQGRGLITRHLDRPLPVVAVAPDSSLIGRGRHLAEVRCALCHAPDISAPGVLSGGRENFLAIPGGPNFGTLFAPNITPGGVLATASDAQLSRAIREGIGQRGQALLVMPSSFLHILSDRDLAALIAFLRAQPAVDHATPARRLNPLAYLILGLHKYEDSAMGPVIQPIPDVPEDSSAVYGRYLATILGCGECHGLDLRGGVSGQFPPLGPDLAAVARQYPLTAFDLALRQGVHTSGRAMNPGQMPWPVFSRLTDLEVRAIYAYLRSGPTRPD
jgi:mono/diheme cytochrome c family protein